jgi:hypothetical protein
VDGEPRKVDHRQLIEDSERGDHPLVQTASRAAPASG